MGLLGDIADFGKGVTGNDLKRTAGSPILVAGQQTIESMKHSTGVGDPETGQRFGEGADQIGAAEQMLVSAFPEDSWDSSGASAYASRNSEQLGRVQTMLGLDHMVARVLSAEAGQIAATRDSLDGHSDWLGAMSLLTTSAGIVPGFGAAARMSADFAMVTKAVGDSNDDLRALGGHIDHNAAVLDTAAAQYEALAGGTSPAVTQFEPPVDEPPVDEPPVDEPQMPSAAEDPEATAPGGPTDGGDVPSGSSAPSGGGGAAPPGSSAPSSAPSMAAMPAASMAAMPAAPMAAMPAAGSPPPDVAANLAGALGGILGSVISPISGILAGFTQAAGQAAQMATQSAQTDGSAVDAAQLNKDLDKDLDKDNDERDGRNEKDEHDKDDKDPRKDGAGQEGEPAEDPAGDSSTKDSARGPAEPPRAGADDGAVKTLPPDLEAVAAGGTAAGPAPVHVGADFEQGELHVAAAATLDRGVPGSATVIDR